MENICDFLFDENFHDLDLNLKTLETDWNMNESGRNSSRYMQSVEIYRLSDVNRF